MSESPFLSLKYGHDDLSPRQHMYLRDSRFKLNLCSKRQALDPGGSRDVFELFVMLKICVRFPTHPDPLSMTVLLVMHNCGYKHTKNRHL